MSQITLSPAALVHFIRGLQEGRFVHPFFTYESPKPGYEYIQLPENVTKALNTLAAFTHDSYFKDRSHLQRVKSLIFQLYKYAKACHIRSANAQNKHAEYLLGLLLFHNPKINFGNVTYSINDLMYKEMPASDYKFLNGGGCYIWHAYSVPKNCDFLDASWREKQNYPDIDTIYQCWLKRAQRLTLEKEAKERERQIQAQREAYIQRHFFTTEVLSMTDFLFVLQAYFLRENVHLSDHPNSILGSRTLSYEASEAFRAFQWTHSSLNYEDGYGSIFLDNFITALHNNARNSFADHQVLGFLLYHNLRHQCGETTLSVFDNLQSNLRLNERTPDWSLLAFNPHYRAYQNYPGKDELTYIIWREQSKEYQQRQYQAYQRELQQMQQAQRHYFTVYSQQQNAYAANGYGFTPPNQNHDFDPLDEAAAQALEQMLNANQNTKKVSSAL